MTITLHLDPHAEAQLREQAEVQGLDVDTLVTTHVQALLERSSLSRETPGLAPEEFDQLWGSLSDGSESLPILSREELTREALYADHD